MVAERSTTLQSTNRTIGGLLASQSSRAMNVRCADASAGDVDHSRRMKLLYSMSVLLCCPQGGGKIYVATMRRDGKRVLYGLNPVYVFCMV